MNLFRKKDKKVIFLLNQEDLNFQANLVYAECIMAEFIKFNYECYCFYSNPFFILCENLDNVFLLDGSFEENSIFNEIRKHRITEAFLLTFDEKTLQLANSIKKKFNISILNEPLSNKKIKIIEEKYSANFNNKEKKANKYTSINFTPKSLLSTISTHGNDSSDSQTSDELDINYLPLRNNLSNEVLKENTDYITKFRISFFLDRNKNYFIYTIGEYLLQDDEEILLFPSISLTKEIELKIEEVVDLLAQDKLLSPNLYSLDLSISNNSKIFFKLYSDNLNLKNFVSNLFNFKHFICFVIDFFINHNFQKNCSKNFNQNNIFERELSKMIYINKQKQDYKYFVNKSVELNFYELKITTGEQILKKIRSDYLLKLFNKSINIDDSRNLNKINDTFYLSDKIQLLTEISLVIFIEDDLSREKKFFYKQVYKKIGNEESILATTSMDNLIYASYLDKKFITISNNTLVKVIENIRGLKYYFLFGDLYLNLDIINIFRKHNIANMLKNDNIKSLKNKNIHAGLSTFSEEELSYNHITDLKVIIVKNDLQITKIFINVLRENNLYIIDDSFLNFWLKDLEKRKTKSILENIEDFKFLIIHYTCNDTDIILNSISFDLSIEMAFYSNLIDKNLLLYILGNANYIPHEIKELKKLLVLKRRGDNFLILQDFTIGKIYFNMIRSYYKNILKNKIILINVSRIFYTKYFTICHYLINEDFIVFSEDDEFIHEINRIDIKVFKYSDNIDYSVYIEHGSDKKNIDKNNKILKLNHFLEVEFFIQGIRFFKKFWLNR